MPHRSDRPAQLSRRHAAGRAERARAAVHPARRVRAARRRHRLDVGGDRRLRAARRRGEGDPAGADAHRGRRLAQRREGRPPDPVAPHRRRAAAADRRRRAHLLVHGRRRELGRPLAAGRGPDPGPGPQRPARRAHPAELGGFRLARPRPVDQRAPGARGRGGAGAPRGRASPATRTCSPRPGPGWTARPAWCARPGTWPRSSGSTSGSSPSSAGAEPGDVLARQVELVHAWRRFPAIDPALPRELLPARWSGLEAARLFAGRRDRWSPGAQAEWKRLNDQPSGPAGGGLQGGQREPAVMAPDDLAGG